MLGIAITALVISLIAGTLGFTGIAAGISLFTQGKNCSLGLRAGARRTNCVSPVPVVTGC